MYSKYVLFSAILYYFLCHYCKACLSVRNSRFINKLLLLLLFFRNILKIFQDGNIVGKENIIIGGDFNCALTLRLYMWDF